ncbi:MAG: fumarylacetoacetate hydrolase family protein [Puniceicoccaceae bacterium]
MQFGKIFDDTRGPSPVWRESAEDRWKHLEGSIFGDYQLTTEEASGLLIAPVDPPAIYCIGLNYRDHAAETGQPLPEFPIVFMKAPTSVIGPQSPIELPPVETTETVDFEVELVAVIGERCRDVSRSDALSKVLGYTIANDVSARNWQSSRGGGQFCRAKSFDTFCPVGPWIVTGDAISDPHHLELSTRVNGDLMQNSNTREMVFNLPELIEFLSISTTLEPGTIILTGTPSGVGVARKPPRYLRDGDLVSLEIEGIGVLENPVRTGR